MAYYLQQCTCPKCGVDFSTNINYQYTGPAERMPKYCSYCKKYWLEQYDDDWDSLIECVSLTTEAA